MWIRWHGSHRGHGVACPHRPTRSLDRRASIVPGAWLPAHPPKRHMGRRDRNSAHGRVSYSQWAVPIRYRRTLDEMSISCLAQFVSQHSGAGNREESLLRTECKFVAAELALVFVAGFYSTTVVMPKMPSATDGCVSSASRVRRRRARGSSAPRRRPGVPARCQTATGPTSICAMLTPASPRIVPTRPTMPGRSRLWRMRMWPRGTKSVA